MSEQTLRLIEKVREHTFLYDHSHNLYKDVFKKAEIWSKIAQDLNITDDAAKIKWKSLRDSYLRYKKAGKFTTGQPKKYRKWPWISHLQFLDHFLRPRSRSKIFVHPSRGTPESTTESIPESTTESTNESTTEGKQVQTKHGHSSQLRQNDSHTLPTIPTMPPFSSTKEPPECTQCNDVDKVIRFLEKRRRTNESLDDVDYLFLSYAQTLKKFSPRSQAMLKMELAALFGRTEIAELNASMSSTESPPDSSSEPSAQTANFEGKVEYQQPDFSVVSIPNMTVSNGIVVNSMGNTYEITTRTEQD